MSATPLVLESRVDRVTVFRNGALVVRRGSVATPESWPAELRVPGLPLLFQSDTLRLRVLSPGVSAGPVEEVPELTGEHTPRPALERELELAQLELKALQDEDRTQARLQEMFDGLELDGDLDLPPELGPEWPSLDAWTGLTDAADRGRAQVAARRVELREAIRAAVERIAATQGRLQTDDRPTASVHRGLRATLRRGEGAAPPTLEIEVEYFVAGARWSPSYALDVTAAGAATLRLSAWVAQASGEDWRGVSVSVCTADLRRTASLPKLPAWKIGRAVGASPSGWRPLPEDLEGLYADFDRVGPRPASRPKPVEGKRKKARPQAQEDLDFGTYGSDDAAPSSPAPHRAELEAQARQRVQVSASIQAPGAPPPAPPPPAPLGGAPMPPAMSAPMPAAPPQVMRSAAPKGRSSGLARAAGALAEMAFDAEEAGGGGFGGPPAPPPPPLDPGRLLDYAWLRLPAFTERGRRGRLWPVDAMSDLRALAEERGLGSMLAPIERALEDQRAALRRLAQAPLPPGCVGLDASSFQHCYPGSARLDVPADGRFVQVPVLEGQASARALFRVVPRQSPTAFRSVRLNNPLSAPLPQGPVRVTLDGDVRVAGALGPFGAGAEIRLDLGVEEGLRIARNATYQEEEKGVLTSTTVGTHKVKVEIANRLDEIVQIQIFERLPIVPEGLDLQVSLDQCSSQPTRDLDPGDQRLEGALRWELSVPARGKAELSYQYTVRLPARMELVGGTRREP